MLTEKQQSELIRAAIQAREFAYAPYSQYRVGAALLTSKGNIYRGVNVENAVYPVGTCAEQVAVFSAVTQGEREFEAIAVATNNGGTPCGSCRQVLSEFGLQTLVIIVDASGLAVLKSTVADLLPGAFGSKDLGM